MLCTLAPPVGFQGRPPEANAIAREAAGLAERNGRPIVIAATGHVQLAASLYTGARPTMIELASLRERAERPHVPAVRAYTMSSYGLAVLAFFAGPFVVAAGLRVAGLVDLGGMAAVLTLTVAMLVGSAVVIRGQRDAVRRW